MQNNQSGFGLRLIPCLRRLVSEMLTCPNCEEDCSVDSTECSNCGCQLHHSRADSPHRIEVVMQSTVTQFEIERLDSRDPVSHPRFGYNVDTVYVVRRSPFSGRSNRMSFKVDDPRGFIRSVFEYYDDPRLSVQAVFPYLCSDIREFLLTGVTPSEWDTTFPPDSPKC